MIQLQSLGSTPLDLQPQLQWLWHSTATKSFVVGDERIAYAIPQTGIGSPTRLDAARPFDPSSFSHHPCNLPIPGEYYEEIRQYGWHGFKLLSESAYDRAVDSEGHPVGDLLRTLVFGPNYGHYVLHESSSLVFGLRSGSMTLLQLIGETFSVIGETRTRGRAALAFCAHPSEELVVYGDNFGNFHAHQFTKGGFGNAQKIAVKDSKASAVEFIDSNTLIVGGMGYLASYAYSSGKFSPLYTVIGAVRDFQWIAERSVLFVNQGIHGVAAYRYGDTGFARIGGVQPSFAVNQMTVSRCGTYLAVSSNQSSSIAVFAANYDATI